MWMQTDRLLRKLRINYAAMSGKTLIRKASPFKETFKNIY